MKNTALIPACDTATSSHPAVHWHAGVVIVPATFNPSFTPCLFPSLHRSFNPCQSIHLSPHFHLFCPPSLISILSFSSIRPNHLSPFEVMESSTPNLRSVRPSLPLPDLYSVTSSTVHLFVPLQPCWISWRCPLAPFTPPPLLPVFPAVHHPRQWCSLLLMLLCKPTLTAT